MAFLFGVNQLSVGVERQVHDSVGLLTGVRDAVSFCDIKRCLARPRLQSLFFSLSGNVQIDNFGTLNGAKIENRLVGDWSFKRYSVSSKKALKLISPQQGTCLFPGLCRRLCEPQG